MSKFGALIKYLHANTFIRRILDNAQRDCQNSPVVRDLLQHSDKVRFQQFVQCRLRVENLSSDGGVWYLAVIPIILQ